MNKDQFYQLRQSKLQSIQSNGQLYPNDFRRTVFSQEIHQKYSKTDSDTLREINHVVSVAGRLLSRRRMGKVTFADLSDMTGKIQLFVKQSVVENYELFDELDIGDVIGASGKVFRTKTGELSIEIDKFQLLSKALHPFPEKFHGLSDQELRYRQRYLDLIFNEDVRNTFHTRAKIVRFIRRFMDARQFLEVETPMMHSIPGGALARPFKTHHNALSLDMYLRVAPELFLKRLVVGGYERVYEINRNFRNEGVSTQHNPEFTMLEFYQAYADYMDFIELTEEMMENLVMEVVGSSTFEYQGLKCSLKPPYKKISLMDAVLEHNPVLKKSDLKDYDRLKKYLKNDLNVEALPSWGVGKLLFEVFEKTVEHKLLQPTFITQYPVEVSPLSRVNDNNSFVTDRFEFFVAGMEIANGFSELNDPEDQAARFRKQMENRESGDVEAMHFDSDYIRALEYGLPPSAGEGIGIDRLVMLLTNNPSIRDVILFPYLKPMNR